ncbi:MAG: 16S rRNA (guanine(527)-N(7))-methyltransferase RsmG [Lachnospiraceae bacterium]|nr:16S rRNA (guanine(527)-N(7))-methyltransferase RsmG [Lachnospiraceae bacterium]
MKQDYLQEVFQSLGISLTGRQAGDFLRFYELLAEKNKVMNLTAITEFDEAAVKHFADSAVLFSPLFRGKLSALGISENPTVIDVGTGAGFPGLPLAIVNPEAKVYLLDALQKRIDFLSDVIGALGLKNVFAAHGRAEEGVRFDLPEMFIRTGILSDEDAVGACRGFFDLAVSRAVSDLAVLSEYCLPYVRVGGVFAAYKSAASDDEIRRAEKAIEILGGEIAEEADFTLPVTNDPRRIVLIKKGRETPGKYPRKAGKPEKKPLS